MLAPMLTGELHCWKVLGFPARHVRQTGAETSGCVITGVESRLGSVQQGDAPLDLPSLTRDLPAVVDEVVSENTEAGASAATAPAAMPGELFTHSLK
jgi:hypothetical protein